jgi:hypothetical protein
VSRRPAGPSWGFAWRLGVSWFLLFLLFVVVSQSACRGAATSESTVSSRRAIVPWPSTRAIGIRSADPFPAMPLAAIDAVRRAHVTEHALLGLFPPDYSVHAGPGASVWAEIDPDVGWIPDTRFYLSNPYLLVVMSQRDFVNPLMIGARWPDVTYDRGTFVETWRGDLAPRWADLACRGAMPCEIRLWFVNALDAGLCYAHVDPAHSRNVAIPPHLAGRPHVLAEACRPLDYFHRGSRSLNNLSPVDERFHLRVSDPSRETVIHVKLWTARPAGPDAPADVVWETRILAADAYP